MKDNTKAKIKKYTTAAASTVAGEAVGIAMGEMLSTDGMNPEIAPKLATENTDSHLAADNSSQEQPITVDLENADIKENDVEVIDVIPNVNETAGQTASPDEPIVLEVDAGEALNDNLPETTNTEMQTELPAEEEIAVLETTTDPADVALIAEETQIDPSTEVDLSAQENGLTQTIFSADANGMPDYVNNANVDDFMA